MVLESARRGDQAAAAALGLGLGLAASEQTLGFSLPERMGLMFSHRVTVGSLAVPTYLRSISLILMSSQGLLALQEKVSTSELALVPFTFLISTLVILMRDGFCMQASMHIINGMQ